MYRVGFITDGCRLGKQYRDLLDWVQAQPDMEVGGIIAQHPQRPPAPRTLASLAFSVVTRAEMMGLRKSSRMLNSVTYDDVDAPRIHVTPKCPRAAMSIRFRKVTWRRFGRST